jgi:thymidylate synthase
MTRQTILWPVKGRGDGISEAESNLLSLGADQFKVRTVSLENQFAASLVNLLNYGTPSGDRTGTGTLRHQSQYFHLDVSGDRLPALRGKLVHIDKIVVEALWMFLGLTNIKFLNERGVNYWNDWADPTGELGPIYGHQMRSFAGIDQLKALIDAIKSDPDSRRLLMTLWNPADLPKMRLPPCHLLYQICVYQCGETGRTAMDMHVTQRSGDAFLGIPYDFVLFTTFFKIISMAVNLPMKSIHYTVADYHMYVNHEAAVRRYIDNVVLDPLDLLGAPMPTMAIGSPEGSAAWGVDEWLGWVLEDHAKRITVSGYKAYPHIGAKIAV